MIVRGLAVRAARNPIEVVVTVFCVVTLAYLKLLHNLTHSSFLDSLVDYGTTASYHHISGPGSSGSLLAADAASAAYLGQRGAGAGGALHATASALAWSKNLSTEVGSSRWYAHGSFPSADEGAGRVPVVSLRPLILVDAEEEADASSPRGDALLRAVAGAFQSATGASPLPPLQQSNPSQGRPQLAYVKAFEGSNADAEEKDLLVKLSESAFLEDVVAAAVGSKVKAAPSQHWELSPVFSEHSLLQAGRPVPNMAHSQHPSEQMKSFRWMAYASRALVHKFLALLKVRSSSS